MTSLKLLYISHVNFEHVQFFIDFEHVFSGICLPSYYNSNQLISCQCSSSYPVKTPENLWFSGYVEKQYWFCIGQVNSFIAFQIYKPLHFRDNSLE